MLKVPKIRSVKHRKFIASLPCVCCGRRDVQAAHIRSGNGAGVGLKSGDDCTLPLCAPRSFEDKGCHAKQHHIGEVKFWSEYGGIEQATALAKNIYAVSGDENAALILIARWK